MRSVARIVVITLVLTPAAPVYASDKGDSQLAAPSKAVAEAWAREAVRRTAPSQAVTALQISYAGLQTADMWTTITARNNGAREVNPLMDGSYTKGIAFKAVMTASTILATRAIGKKNKKAGVMTMVVLNGMTAAVVANNMRHGRR